MCIYYTLITLIEKAKKMSKLTSTGTSHKEISNKHLSIWKWYMTTDTHTGTQTEVEKLEFLHAAHRSVTGIHAVKYTAWLTIKILGILPPEIYVYVNKKIIYKVLFLLVVLKISKTCPLLLPTLPLMGRFRTRIRYVRSIPFPFFFYTVFSIDRFQAVPSQAVEVFVLGSGVDLDFQHYVQLWMTQDFLIGMFIAMFSILP